MQPIVRIFIRKEDDRVAPDLDDIAKVASRKLKVSCKCK